MTLNKYMVDLVKLQKLDSRIEQLKQAEIEGPAKVAAHRCTGRFLAAFLHPVAVVHFGVHTLIRRRRNL